MPCSIDCPEIRGFHRTQAAFSLSGAAKTAKKYASHGIWPTARKLRHYCGQHPRGPYKKSNIFLRKSAIFQSLMRGTAKWHGCLPNGAHLVAKGVLGHMGQIHRPHFHMHRGKIGQSFTLRVFRRTQAGLGVDGPTGPLGTSIAPLGHQQCTSR